jgi:hypothetical protein
MSPLGKRVFQVLRQRLTRLHGGFRYRHVRPSTENAVEEDQPKYQHRRARDGEQPRQQIGRSQQEICLQPQNSER